METRFQTAYNAKTRKGQIFELVSLTVPDQTYSVRQILEKTQNGMIVTAKNYNNFEEEPDVERVAFLQSPSLDIQDVHEYSQQLQERISLSEKKELERQQELEKQAKEAELEALKASIRKELLQTHNP